MTRLPETRHSLLVRLSEPADADAWFEFQAIYEQAILRYAKSRGLQEADALEVVQQVMTTVHGKIGQWRPAERPGAFRAWLLETARRVSLRALRDQRRSDLAKGGTSVLEQLGQAPAVSSGREQDIDVETREWRRWAFCWAATQVEREVEPATWQAFWLTAVEEQSPAQTAARLEMKVGGVYTAKCRVLARIRELVRELPDGES